MEKNRICELLSIRYPIVQAPMNWVSGARLVAAVSNAGGLGIITSAHLETPMALREEIRKTKSLTDKPFGVNISMFPSVKPTPNREFIEVITEEGVKAVETSGHQSPAEFVPRLKEGNVIIIHKAATVRHCVKAQDVGADILPFLFPSA